MINRTRDFENGLLDLIQEEVLGLSSEELKIRYQCEDLRTTDDFKSTRSLVDSVLSARKVNRLQLARQELDALREREDDSTRRSKIEDAKAFIISLMASGRLPNEFTLAFREGEDIPDSEIESIIEDLRELGFDIGDE
ncbi:hypothetical protein [Haliea salexigens]|uniref:hypothetical protein n=1 Tax=Haliea salexigens TaxID=287487 RepID=UPI000483F919|nr:hypothetical protein [Haliea salexigens]